MIIIDKERYDKLRKATIETKVVLERYALEKEHIDPELVKLFRNYILDTHNLNITAEQVGLIELPLLEWNEQTNVRPIQVFFKPNRRNIALLDTPEEVVEVPLNFTSPFVVQAPLRQPRIETYGEVETFVPYDVVQYFPWGYDLERNVQIWKKK